MNFQPSPELLKQMLGGMSQQGPAGMGGNTGYTGGMNLGMPQMSPMPMPHTGGPMPGQGIDVGSNLGMPPMGIPPMNKPMPVSKPPMGVKPPVDKIKPLGKPVSKPMSKPMGGGIMQAYGQTKRAY